MTSPLQTITNLGLTEKIYLESLADVLLALKTQIVFCDLIKGTGVPVCNARRFTAANIPKDISTKDPLWTTRAFRGTAMGFEVLTLEGWSVPEKVYYVVKKEVLW